MPESDDVATLARIAQGDATALSALYDAYRPRLRRFLWQSLDGDTAAIEDALQETFLAVWQGAGRFRGLSRPATWIFEIARHQAAHARRRLSRHPVAPLPAEDTAPATRTSLDDRLELVEALAALPAKHRAAVDLVFVQGFSVNEAAAILDIPSGTVKSRLSVARQALRRALTASDTTEVRP